MKWNRNEKSIESQLLQLMDAMVLEPGQKKLAVSAMKQLLHASKVKDVKRLLKAMDDFLGRVLRGGVDTSDIDD